MSGQKDPYATLGVSRNATKKDIKKAYRKLAVRYHPDKNPGNAAAEEKFKEVSAAYEILSDPQKKQQFDQFGFIPGEGQPGADAAGGGAGFGAGFQGTDPRKLFEMFFQGNDPFGGLFGGGMGGMGGMGGPGATMFSFGGMPGMDGMRMGGMGGPFGQMGGGFAGMPGDSKRAERSDVIPRGAQVVIFGLRNATEHNGKSGRVRGFNESKERYTVELGDSGEQLSLRQGNLTQLVDGVELTGIAAKPSFNGKRGQVVGWDADRDRYVIRLSDGPSLSLKPEKLILPGGTRIVLRGLNSQQHNGLRGKITSFDTASGRYLVQLGAGKSIRVKLSNVKA